MAMSLVEIRDFQVWAKHIHGNESLKDKIIGMKAGDLIELEVGGFRGIWEKMQDNSDTRGPTEGIKPIGKARGRWHEHFRERREELVAIAEAPRPETPTKSAVPVPAKSPAPAA